MFACKSPFLPRNILIDNLDRISSVISRICGGPLPLMVILNYDERFRGEVMQTIKDGITKLLGKDVAEVIFYNFSKETGLDKDEIVRRPDLFEDTLVKMFGERGSLAIRSAIIKEINAHFQLPSKEIPPSAGIELTIRSAWRARSELRD